MWLDVKCMAPFDPFMSFNGRFSFALRPLFMVPFKSCFFVGDWMREKIPTSGFMDTCIGFTNMEISLLYKSLFSAFLSCVKIIFNFIFYLKNMLYNVGDLWFIYIYIFFIFYIFVFPIFLRAKIMFVKRRR